ncbi:MAG: sulfatase [Verrucomicrobia bacterium]|nr:sulfatase [Verrucomicrobiota bacterium]
MRAQVFSLILVGVATLTASNAVGKVSASHENRPNVVFVLADQWRAQATGYAGDPNASTPNLDKLAGQAVNMVNAISGSSVCSPYRASLMTGMYPLTHGVFINDFHLKEEYTCLGDVFKSGGYDTAYVGKWHLDGRGRTSYIPPESRQGFDYWKAFECTHNYMNSYYYEDNSREKKKWAGYDAVAQTDDLIRYLGEHKDMERPFIYVLSWGPPHAPYRMSPQEYKESYKDREIKFRDNVPAGLRGNSDVVDDLRGYYAHIEALDDCMGRIMKVLVNMDLMDNTILIFTSDHGDMLYSHGMTKKQRPYDESCRVPLLIKIPGVDAREIDMPLNTPDIMPTLLGLCGLNIPEGVEGNDYSDVLNGEAEPGNDDVLLSCPIPFHQWSYNNGGTEYRGVRTRRYTYVRDLEGPWLLFDNYEDPFQMNNLVDDKAHTELKDRLDDKLRKLLENKGDEFKSGWYYVEQWGYEIDERGNKPGGY